MPGGAVLVEIHEDRTNAVMEVFRTAGATTVETRKDLMGKDRMIKAIWYPANRTTARASPAYHPRIASPLPPYFTPFLSTASTVLAPSSRATRITATTSSIGTDLSALITMEG